MRDLPFIPGLVLSGWLFDDAVDPLLKARWPALDYAAARLGEGSDVLGFDTDQSMDHDWGPRLTIFLADDAPRQLRADLLEALAIGLPPEIRGYPLEMAWSGSSAPLTSTGVPMPRIDVTTVRELSLSRLGIEPDAVWGALEWLAVPEQILLSLTSGCVFHDGLGTLAPLRDRLAYYPQDVWLYLLSAGWSRIAQEEPFMGRCGQVGDEAGSRLVAARLVRDVMRLCFLMERRYAPYMKWLGTAFARLPCGPRYLPLFEAIWRAETWRERQPALVAVLEEAARMHNELGLTEPIAPEARPFYERPFLVIDGERYARALHDLIRDPDVLSLPAFIGGVDQWVDSTGVLSEPDRYVRVRRVLEAWRERP